MRHDKIHWDGMGWVGVWDTAKDIGIGWGMTKDIVGWTWNRTFGFDYN